MHPPNYTPKYTNQKQGTSNVTWIDGPMHAPGCLIRRLGELQVQGTGSQVACGRWWVAGGGWWGVDCRRQVAGNSGQNHDIS